MSKELILNNPNYVTANLARTTHRNSATLLYKAEVEGLRTAIDKFAKRKDMTFSSICYSNNLPTSIIAKSIDRYLHYGEGVAYPMITKPMRKDCKFAFFTKHELEQIEKAFELADIRVYLVVNTPEPKPVPESHKRQMAENKIGPAIAAINSKAAKVSDLTPGELYTLISLAVAAGRNVDLTPPEV